MTARVLAVIAGFSAVACVGTLEGLPRQTTSMQLTELRFREAHAAQLRPGAAPGARRVACAPHSRPFDDVRSGSLLLQDDPDELLAARDADPGGTLHLDLRCSVYRGRHSTTSPASFTTPWSNVTRIRERIRYQNNEALAVFFGGLMISVASTPAFIVSGGLPNSSSETMRVIGGGVLALGVITAIAGGVYGLHPDDVRTVWEAP